MNDEVRKRKYDKVKRTKLTGMGEKKMKSRDIKLLQMNRSESTSIRNKKSKKNEDGK